MSKDSDIAQEINDLRKAIERHEYLYRVESNPEISDQEFDRLLKRLAKLESEYPLFASAESPTQKVGDDRLAAFKTVAHLLPMQSLDNTYNQEELYDFDKRLRKLLGHDSVHYWVEPKIDGLAICLTYESGKLVRAVTRGNGIEGDDVTANVKTISALPQRLKGTDHPELIEIRGEIFMSQAEFERINKEREEQELPLYMNPRNLASGTIKQLDSRVVAQRKLEIVLYGLGAHEGFTIDRQSELLHTYRAWGLPTPEGAHLTEGIEAAWEKIETLDKSRHEFAFPTDGAVIKLDSIADQLKVGSTAKAPRWAISYKFAAEQAETLLERITIQIGRTGVLTPVAELKPVLIAGTTVSRATLHNEDEIRRKDIRIGDTVVVEKAGEIIPAVVRVVLENRPADTKPFDFSAYLQKLGYDAVRVEGQAAWRLKSNENPLRLRRQLEHFSSRTAMDIDGLGKEIINQLVTTGLVKDPADIYDLEKEELLSLEKFADKSATNLIAAIEDSKGNDLWRLIHGLGIPNVGAEAAKTLAKKFETLDKLKTAPADELQEIDGIGPVMAQSIEGFFQDELQQKRLERFAQAGLNFENRLEKPVADSAVAGKTFVITGTLPSLSRDEAKALLESAGAKVTGSVSKNTDYLLAGESAGSKYDKALKLEIPILSEEELKNLLTGNGG